MLQRALPASPQPQTILALTAIVTALHGLLLASLAPRERPALAARPMGVVTLRVRPQPAPRPAAASPLAAAPHRAAADASPAAPGRAAPAPRALPAHRSPAADAGHMPGGSTGDPASDQTPLAPNPERGTPAAETAPGLPPPLYPTRLPQPARLHYAAQVNGVAAEAELDWQHDGQRYRLDLSVRGALRGLVEQRSEGGFDVAGIAPERFVDRRRGRLVGATHFRRDIGRITFSGPSVDYPAWPGAQDRLAWLPQIAAVLAAADSPPAELRFFVADARGIARAWDFRSEGRETVDTDAGPVLALKYVREPMRPDDLRIGVWLDQAAGWWPVRIDFLVPIGRSRLTLTRRSIDSPPPAQPGS